MVPAKGLERNRLVAIELAFRAKRPEILGIEKCLVFRTGLFLRIQRERVFQHPLPINAQNPQSDTVSAKWSLANAVRVRRQHS